MISVWLETKNKENGIDLIPIVGFSINPKCIQIHAVYLSGEPKTFIFPTISYDQGYAFVNKYLLRSPAPHRILTETEILSTINKYDEKGVRDYATIRINTKPTSPIAQ